MSNDSLVNIIGSNIAGILSASQLYKEKNIKIYEEDKKGHNKAVCSGLISKNGAKEVEKNFNIKKALLNKIYGANIYIGNKLKKISIIKDNEVAYVFDRILLDESGREFLEDKGIGIHYNKRMKEQDVKKLSSVIIGADGPFSVVAKTFNFPRLTKFIYGFYFYKEKVPKEFSSFRYVSIFLNKHFPGFFGWIIPRLYNYEVGFGLENPKDIKKALFFFKKLGIKNSNIIGAPIPIKIRKRVSKRVENKEIYLIGDASGLTKSLTGGGIVYTTYAAKVLRKAIIEKNDYEKNLKALIKEQTLHLLLQRIFSMLSRLDYPFLFNLIKAFDIDLYLKDYGDMDMPSKFLNINSFSKFLLKRK